MCPCDLSIPDKQYRENCQNHAAWVMLIFLAHIFFRILLGMSLICKTANNPNSSDCWWWMVTTTYWRLTLTVGQKLVYPFGTYVISAPPGRIHRGKGGAIQPIVSFSFSEGTIDNLLQACVNFAVVVWDRVSLASNPWWSFCLSFSEHHILLMSWLYERAVTLAHPSMPAMVLSDLWSLECDTDEPNPSQFSNTTVSSEIYTANWNHAPNFEYWTFTQLARGRASQLGNAEYPQKFLAGHAILRRNNHDFIQPTVLVRWHIYQGQWLNVFFVHIFKS